MDYRNQSGSVRDRSSWGQEHGESSGQVVVRDRTVDTLRDEYYNVRQLDDIRKQTGFKLAPKATRQRYERRLARRATALYNDLQQFTPQRHNQRHTLEWGPFPPGEAVECARISSWSDVAETSQPTEVDVVHSRWALEWEQATVQAEEPETAKKEKHRGSRP